MTTPLPFRWDECNPRFGLPFAKLYLGTLCLGSVNPDGKSYRYHCALPGIKRELMYRNGIGTDTEARRQCEGVASEWFAVIDKARS